MYKYKLEIKFHANVEEAAVHTHTFDFESEDDFTAMETAARHCLTSDLAKDIVQNSILISIEVYRRITVKESNPR